ncbi:MAG: hypothetical protein JWQ71_3929 [Pedosphaera sp.]|nr:hypothetical protein [Pedosphaera sp.]
MVKFLRSFVAEESNTLIDGRTSIAVAFLAMHDFDTHITRSEIDDSGRTGNENVKIGSAASISFTKSDSGTIKKTIYEKTHHQTRANT